MRISRLSSYVRYGVLPYEEQEKEGVKRYYDKAKTLKRLKDIQEAEKEGFTKKEMIDFFLKKDLFDKISKDFDEYR